MLHSLPRTSVLPVMPVLVSKPANLLLFNLMWLGCVIGRDDWLWFVAPLVLSYLALLLYSRTLLWWQIAVPAVIGISSDLAMTALGLFEFENAPLLIPLWLVVLWLAFSATLNLSLSFLRQRLWFGVLAGALAFPFNYGVGERLGAVAFPASYAVVMTALGVTWMLLLPVLIRVSARPGAAP